MAINSLASRPVLAALLAVALFLLLSLTAAGHAAMKPAEATIPACDPISAHTTWTTGNVYVVENCNLVVAAGATLTLQPGVAVKFGGVSPGYGSAPGSAALIVHGTLNAQGTQAQPVAFTSLKDDAHGGDSNGGGTSSGAAGDWYGIVFQPGSTGHLDHFFVGYAGSGVFNATLGYGRAQVDVKAAAVQLRDGTITTGLRKGIYLEGEGITPLIENVQIANNVGATGYTDRGYAIYQLSINMQPTYRGLTFSGNDADQVMIDINKAMDRSATLGGAPFGFVCGYSLCLLTVPDGATLTVAPGTRLDFGPPYGITVADGGALVAEGTASQPIVFTSTAAAASQQSRALLAQEWIGLWARQGSKLRLDHCDISYGSDGNFGNGGLEIDTDDAQVKNCKIHHNRQTGLYLASMSGSTARPVLTNVDVTDNGRSGVHLEARSGSVLSVTWNGGVISRNGWSGVSSYTSNSLITPTWRNLTIADNGAAGDTAERRAGIYWYQHNINPDLENLTLTGNVGTAALWYCNGSITASNLTATGNGSDELQIPGCEVYGGRQWDLGDASIPIRVTGHVEVMANGLLSILPGATLHFDKNPYSSPTVLRVRDQAALYALGTAERPIVFTGNTPEPGWWTGISAVDRAQLVLRHCEIGYGGGGAPMSLEIRWGLSGGVPAADIQQCEVHHSATRGVRFDFANFPDTTPPIFHYNHLHDNAEEGVANWDAPPLDARDNYWGDPTGPYHATQNPGGQGDKVGDNILFYPWLNAPSSGVTAPGAMLVTTGAPNLVSPGQTVDYAIQYLNGMTETVRNGLLVVQLPRAAEYVASSGGGSYWPERDQVFWMLGDLPAGSQGFLSFRVRFAWGLPREYADSSITLITGDNYNAGEFDARPYRTYQPGMVNGVSLLSQAAFDAQLAASPALRAAYDAALAAGYAFHTAANVTRSEGETVLEAVMVDSRRQATRILTSQGGQVLVYTINPAEVIVEDEGGGMRIDLVTGAKSEWGDWAPSAAISAHTSAADGCLEETCKRNCRWTVLGWEYIKKKAGRVIAWTALAPFTGGGSVAGAVWEIGSAAKKLYDCDLDCRANPSTYCCTAGQVRWSGSGLFDRLTNSCYKEKCNATIGMWVPDGYKTCVAFGQRCVAGIGGPGCVDCEERGASQQFDVQAVTVTAPRQGAEDANTCAAATAEDKPRCRDLELFLAKDPNAIYGSVGDLLPGQTVAYTITYENEGAGRAYGVYVVNPLPAVFDASTLSFVQGNGTYLPASREIFWLVGELGPKGAADAEGEITYTVALTGGLASGTVVANQAVVYFPSVPEETPTNTWVNLVAPLVAVPQRLTTNYRTPLAVVLKGREVSGLPLTYAIVGQPHAGILAGAPPNLTYTPIENFTGADAFTFQVSNGTTTSRAAQVDIDVTAVGDTTPPQVLWTTPAADAKGIDAPATPVFTDAGGAAYAPVLLAGVSEALAPATVNNSTVTLARGGAAIVASATFDSSANQIVITPRAALTPGEYTATVTTAVTDVAGNGLAASYIWRFTVGTPVSGHHIYLPMVQR